MLLKVTYSLRRAANWVLMRNCYPTVLYLSVAFDIIDHNISSQNPKPVSVSHSASQGSVLKSFGFCIYSLPYL